MINLVKIGYDYYAVKNAAAAARIVTALAGVVKLRRDYREHQKDVFYPDEHQDEVAMLLIDEKQLLRAEPFEAEAQADDQTVPRRLRLGR